MAYRKLYDFFLLKVDKFLDKNRDGLRKDLVDLIASCREPVSNNNVCCVVVISVWSHFG